MAVFFFVAVVFGDFFLGCLKSWVLCLCFLWIKNEVFWRFDFIWMDFSMENPGTVALATQLGCSTDQSKSTSLKPPGMYQTKYLQHEDLICQFCHLFGYPSTESLQIFPSSFSWIFSQECLGELGIREKTTTNTPPKYPLVGWHSQNPSAT